MSERVLVALAVAGMIVLAGCGSQGGQQTQSPTELMETESPTPGIAATPTATPTAAPTSAPTPTATPEPTPTDSATASATPSATTTEDSGSMPTTEAGHPERLQKWTNVTEAHRAGFSSLDSFSGVYEINVSGPEEARAWGERNQTIRLKNGSDALWISIEEPQRTVTGYKNSTTATTIYGRLNESGNVSYVQENGEVPQYQFRDLRDPSFFAEFNFTERGVVDTDQGQREVYTVSGVENVDTSAVGVEDATAISLTVHVDPDTGVVTLFDYSVTVERPEGTVEFSQVIRITDMDSTTVEAPDWLDEAKASGS